jgi:hypothetical protein
MTPTYNLPSVNFSTTAPQWVRVVAANQQAQVDSRYKMAVDGYYSASQQWLDQQTYARTISPDPTKFVPAPFTTPIPTRLEYLDWDPSANGGAGDWITTTWSDPTIQPPQLPTYVPPPPAGKIATSAPTDEANNASFQAQLMSMQLQQNQKLDALTDAVAAIRTKLGV